jgi:transposase InsO family protein
VIEPLQQKGYRWRRGCGSWVGADGSGIQASVGTTGDSYDNALAESIIGLYKTEVIRRRVH